VQIKVYIYICTLSDIVTNLLETGDQEQSFNDDGSNEDKSSSKDKKKETKSKKRK
jgi:hypothetical protein